MRFALSVEEMELVEFVGVRRSYYARVRGRSRLPGLPGAAGGSDEANDIAACAAEYIIAKTTGLFWSALADNIRKDVLRADVGRDIHVKAISEPHHNLIVKTDDPRFGAYILCLVDIPIVEPLGGYPAAWIDDTDWCATLPVPAYRIPQSALLTGRDAIDVSRMSAQSEQLVL